VRRRVSGATPTLKDVASCSVMVRQVPFTEMESPRWASVRISGQSEMVREVPLPPEELGSRGVREEIVPRVSTRPVNIVEVEGDVDEEGVGEQSKF
jgi:hypothetical protein